MANNKKRWSDYSPTQKAMIVVFSVVELVVTAIAARDLRQRPASQVRGPKFLWWPALLVQPVGSPVYLIVGRKHTT